VTVVDEAVVGPKGMSALEHLCELRRRLLIGVAAVIIATAVAWAFYNPVIGFMVAPYRAVLQHHPHQNISGGMLVATGPLDGFTARLKVSGYLGLVLSAPVWLWELWQFIGPGLHRNERRYAVSFMAAAIVLFSLGVVTALLVFPRAINWLIRVSGPDVAPLFSANRYLGMYALCCLIFGLAFIYPVVLVFLQLIGAVSSTRLRRWRRYAIVALLAIAAFITPSGDPFSFLALAVPLVAFYELSIVVGRLLKR
jgi:sec-independent protein translocase protein TatC